MLCVQVWNAGQHCFMAEASVLAALRERNRTGLAACRLARAEQALLAECTRLDAVERASERRSDEAIAAKAAEARAEDATRAMAAKLEEAMARIGELEHELESSKGERDALRKDNDGLLARLTEQLLRDAESANAEVERSEKERRESKEHAVTADASAAPAAAVATPVD